MRITIASLGQVTLSALTLLSGPALTVAPAATTPPPAAATATPPALPYTVTHTGQSKCYDDRGRIITPAPGDPFFGQDADFPNNPMSFADLGDGTVADRQTGLIWTKAPVECTYHHAAELAAKCRTGGHTDWRVPSVKELYSLMDFRGGSGFSPMRPYLDTSVFEFRFGDTTRGLREIDAQYWSSTIYVGTTMNNDPTVFGVNFADGRIKGYPRDRHPVEGAMKRFTRFVRGNTAYGTNNFVADSSDTITDRATGLMWARADAGKAMNWCDALAYASASRLAGFSDWRLPSAKELQSLVDYSRAPDSADPARRSPAIDPLFNCSDPESYFWSATTHFETPGPLLGTQAVYVCFGRSLGTLPPPPGRTPPPAGAPRPPAPAKVRGDFINVHGAGAQRSDPKSGDPADPEYRSGFGPQGDDIRILNHVRLVRTVKPAPGNQAVPASTQSPAPR
jgi:hypothetical protein